MNLPLSRAYHIPFVRPHTHFKAGQGAEGTHSTLRSQSDIVSDSSQPMATRIFPPTPRCFTKRPSPCKFPKILY